MDGAELLTDLGRIADLCRAQSSSDARKKSGQFFTPAKIAKVMADKLRVVPGQDVRIIDPGAGVGILGIASAASMLERGAHSVHLTAVEPHGATTQLLKEALTLAESHLGPALSYEILEVDFLDFAQPTPGMPRLDPYHAAIANPPYFKMPPSDPRGGGAPNIYARFMEIASRLLVDQGQLCFIIPRSYTSGLYFRRFRESFHSRMSLESVHVFDSRRSAFREERVLQENIIIHCTKRPERNPEVRILASTGLEDLETPRLLMVPENRVVDPFDADAWVHLPGSHEDLTTLDQVEALPARLDSMGLRISTGPVVPFRATDHLVDDLSLKGEGAVPLLWLQHVRRGEITWPLNDRFNKPQLLSADAPSKLLSPNETSLMFRPFQTSKCSRSISRTSLGRLRFGSPRCRRISFTSMASRSSPQPVEQSCHVSGRQCGGHSGVTSTAMYTFFGPRAKGTPSDSLRVRSAHSVTRCATRARLLLGECQRAVGDRENSEDGARLRRWRGRVAAAPYSGKGTGSVLRSLAAAWLRH